MKNCIVTACIIDHEHKQWYLKGINRLSQSLLQTKYAGDFVAYRNTWPNDNYNKIGPYNIKASAIEEALKKGYTKILWCDCSVWALKTPDGIFDMITKEGVLMLTSGYNAAQTCSDKCLEYFNITRDEAEKIPDTSTGCFGFDYETSIGKEFADKWIKSAKDGVFLGSKNHDSQSADPRFLFHRQDQSAASIICGQMNIKLHTYGEYVAYNNENVNEQTIFSLQGMPG